MIIIDCKPKVMEQIKGNKSIQDNDGSMDIPPGINNAKSKAVKKANEKIRMKTSRSHQ